VKMVDRREVNENIDNLSERMGFWIPLLYHRKGENTSGTGGFWLFG